MVVELGDKAAKASFWTDTPLNIQPCDETKQVF